MPKKPEKNKPTDTVNILYGAKQPRAHSRVRPLKPRKKK